MTSTLAYRVLLDWDRDGFFCSGVQAADSLNVIEYPVAYRRVPGAAHGAGATATKVKETTAYGLYRYRVVSADGISSGVKFGADPDTGETNRIMLNTNTAYTAVVWVRRVSGATGDVTVEVVDESGTVLTSDDLTPSTSWSRLSVTFTTPLLSGAILIRVVRASPYTVMTFDVCGLMVVAGPTAPTVFNAGAESNAYDDISAYCRDALSWAYGMNAYGDEFAPPARAMIVLDNVNRHWSPENAASPLYGFYSAGMLVKMMVGVDDAYTDQWIGTAARLQVGSGTNYDRAVLTAEDAMLTLLDAEFAPPLQLNVRTDEVIDTVLDSAVVPYPYPSDTFMLDVSRLDYTGLYESPDMVLEQGLTVIEFAGDNADRGAGVSAQGYLRDAVAAEFGGRFYWDAKRGRFTFHNRTHDLLTGTAWEIDETDVLDSPPPRYLYGDDLVNLADVNYEPRKVGAAASVMYEMEKPRRLPYDKHQTFTVRYADPNDEKAQVGGKDMIQPVPYTDYMAYQNEDGTGTDYTPYIEVLAEFGATSAKITAVHRIGVGRNGESSNHPDDAYLTVLKLRGTPIARYPRESERALDPVSIHAQGVRHKTYDLPMISDAETAAAFANYAVQRGKNPAGRFEEISLEAARSDTLADQLMDIDIGGAVEVYDPDVANQTKRHIVIGVRHEVTVAQSRHRVALVLAPASRSSLFILDDDIYGELDTAQLAI